MWKMHLQIWIKANQCLSKIFLEWKSTYFGPILNFKINNIVYHFVMLNEILAFLQILLKKIFFWLEPRHYTFVLNNPKLLMDVKQTCRLILWLAKITNFVRICIPPRYGRVYMSVRTYTYVITLVILFLILFAWNFT